MNILRAILSEPWAVSSEFFHAMQPVIDEMIKGNAQDLAQFSNQYKPQILTRSGFNIGLLPIQGAITRADYCGDMGTESMSVQLQEWAEDLDIVGVILNINSPGGSVSFTENLANQIKSFPKPIIAYVSGNGASAAYWLASSANKVYLSAETDMVGSIGTMISFQKRIKDGQHAVYDYVSVYADESFDKNAAFDEMLKGKNDRVKSEFLNPLNSVFLNHVQSSRLNVNPDALHGKMYLANQSIEMGLADGIRSVDQVIDEIITMSQNQSNMSIFSKFLGFNQKSNSTMKKNETLSAILGRDVMENETLSAEDNAKITEHIAGASTPPSQAAESNNIAELVSSALSAALAPVTEQLGTINQSVSAISERVNALEDSPASAPTPVAPVAESDEDNRPSFEKSNSAINQLAKSQLGL